MTQQIKPPQTQRANPEGDVARRPSAPVRRSRVGTKLLLLAGSLVFVFALVEIAFRVFIPVTDAPLNVWDPVVGPRRFPNQSGQYLLGDHLHGRYRFNAQGWNHPRDYTMTRPAGTRRVCMVGDSYVEALQVDVNDAMFCVAESTLNAADVKSEWYAFANSGWGTSHEYQLVRHYVLDYQPNLVILFFVQNDPFDSSPYLRPIAASEPRFWLDDDGRLQQMPIGYWEPGALRRFSANFALVRYFVLQKAILGKFGRGSGAPGGFALREEMAGASNAFVPGLEKLDVRARQAKTWELIAALLASMRDQCRARGAQFAVAYRGDITVIDDAIGGVPRWPAKDIPPKDEDPWCLETRYRRMGAEQVGPICERLDIPYLDLTKPLQDAVARTKNSHCFPDNDHFSTAGHEAAGKALAAWAEQLLAATPEAR